MLHRFWCQLARRSQSPIPLHVLGIQAFAVVQLFHVLGGGGKEVCVCVFPGPGIAWQENRDFYECRNQSFKR